MERNNSLVTGSLKITVATKPVSFPPIRPGNFRSKGEPGKAKTLSGQQWIP